MKEIIKNYRNNIKNRIKSLIGNPNEDLEQEVFIKMWRNIGKYKEQGKFKQWIDTITSNICKDFLKSSSTKESKLSDGEDKLEIIKDKKASPEKKLIKKERQKMIISAIDSLKPNYKNAIILYDMKGLSYEEISKKLNCPVGTVKSRIFNARKQLSEILKDLL